ncbi:hypothetical protein SUDANB19_02161 [Streptomyces sp. enrichment culture]
MSHRNGVQPDTGSPRPCGVCQWFESSIARAALSPDELRQLTDLFRTHRFPTHGDRKEVRRVEEG